MRYSSTYNGTDPFDDWFDEERAPLIGSTEPKDEDEED